MKVYQELCKKHTTFRERSGECICLLPPSWFSCSAWLFSCSA